MATTKHINGSANGSTVHPQINSLNDRLKKAKHVAAFHEDESISNARKSAGLFARLGRIGNDLTSAFAVKNWPAIVRATSKAITGQGPDKAAIAQLVASLSRDSDIRNKFMESQVKVRYETLLHPPVTYLGDAFQYRTADGKFNSALHPHLGQAGAPYAKSVPAKTHMLGALPDPGDLFDRLMARQEGGRESDFGLSSMFLYHATLIIHDIFRTNELDKNISDTSSYLDLSPLYGFNDELQRKVRDNKYKLGLLKPDTFAEDRLLRQSPGVCIYMVMYNRYHNYCARQLYQINDNGRFAVPKKFRGSKLAAAARTFTPEDKQDAAFFKAIEEYEIADENQKTSENDKNAKSKLDQAGSALSKLFTTKTSAEFDAFNASYDAAWAKLDDDLFNTARLITCGMYIQISIFDYLKSVMGFHKFDTNFTLDPRINMQEFKNVTRGLGNQVSVEFNLLYRFHPAISLRDEAFAENYMREFFDKPDSWDPKTMGLEDFIMNMRKAKMRESQKDKPEPCQQTFGLEKQADLCFKRNEITGLFDDQQMINELNKAMAAPISQFGPRNVPQCMKAIEMLGIMQARKWGVATLNDFREFFGLQRHDSFSSITGNVEVQEALRDLYENVDKVELYPGLFCETRDETMDGDPGPQNARSVMFIGIVADAITLVRSDRFYTVDWNTHNLTSWGMKEVTPDPDVAKGSVFHRLFQRAFPGWYPSDSIDFFQPFFTPKKNAEYAVAQGYAEDYLFSAQNSGYDTSASLPKRPSKPVYLTKVDDVKAVLADKTDKVVHPVRLHLNLVPKKVAEVLSLQQDAIHTRTKDSAIHGDEKALSTYLTGIMHDMIVRNCMTMDSKKGINQIDITKDFAIPVVSRYVSEFLGIGHLVECVENPKARYTENEIYRHITNCQVYLSYYVDETKLLKRRRDFKKSMHFLFGLALEGNAREANKWGITRLCGSLWPSSWRPNAVSELGLKVAQQILKDDPDSGRAAARMLLIALDSAYNNVLTFTTVLNKLVDGLYDASTSNNLAQCDWTKLQALAMSGTPTSIMKFEEIILKVQRESVKLPIVRKVILPKGEEIHTVRDVQLRNGDTVICDPNALKPSNPGDFEHMAHSSNFTSHLSRYQSQQVAMISLVSMVRVLAQMRNLRRGHDTQGHLKTIKVESISEGYETFMAPGRSQQIATDVDNAEADLSRVYDPNIFRPSTETYMTPEWDEMVPFPTTWKVRFEGFGASDYTASNVLKTVVLPDSMPPFYASKGPSSYGGSFNPVASSQQHTHAAVSSLLGGCALGGPTAKPRNFVSNGV